jgi:peptide/nickel transport system substrate-binding protein
VIVRNPRFRPWAPEARPPGFANQIEVRVRPHKRVERQIDDVLSGRSDVAFVANAFSGLISPARMRSLITQAPGQLHSFPGGNTNWMFLNVRERPFDNLDVRRAVNFATDRARLVELAGGPELVTATCQFIPSGFPGYEPYCPYTAAAAPGRGWSSPDVARARLLIARSGRAGARVTVATPEFKRSVGRYFTGLLNRIGLRARLRVIGDQAYFGTIGDPREHAQIGFFGWGLDYLNPASFIQPTFTCEAPNPARFCDRELERLVAAALEARSGEAARAWALADRRVVDQSPAVPMTNGRAVMLVSDRVGNVQFHMVWSALLDQLWVR